MALTGVLLAGELGGRKMGERAGLKLLLEELPRDSKIRAALEQARKTGTFAPMASGVGQDMAGRTDSPNNFGGQQTVSSQPDFANAKPQKINQWGDPIEEGDASGK